MRQTISILFIVLVFLTGCETEYPFDRGRPDPSEFDAPEVEKPVEKELPAEITPKEYYVKFVEPAIKSDCFACHKGSNAPSNYAEARTMIVPGSPSESELYYLAAGTGHVSVWDSESVKLKTLGEWIKIEDSSLIK